MRKSCWESLGRVGSEGVEGVGTESGSTGSVVAIVLVMPDLLAGFEDMYVVPLVKARLADARQMRCGEKRDLRG